MIYSVSFQTLHTRYSAPYYIRHDSVYFNSPEYKDDPAYQYIRDAAVFLGKVVNLQEMLAEIIKESVDDSFCFVITKRQEEEFKSFIDGHGLSEYVVYEMPYYITNNIHERNGRNLKLVVLCSSVHFWRDMYED